MARDPMIGAMAVLRAKREKWERARSLAAQARDELDEAMRAARRVGMSTTEIGRRVGVSRTRVTQVVSEDRSQPAEG